MTCCSENRPIGLSASGGTRRAKSTADGPRRSCSRVRVVGGEDNSTDWLCRVLERHGHDVARCTSDQPLASGESPHCSAIVLAADSATWRESLSFAEALPPAIGHAVILVVTDVGPSVVRKFIDAGTADFLSLPVSVAELLLRVRLRERCTLRGPGSRNEIDRGAGVVDALSRSVGRSLDRVRLSEREYRLFKALARHCGHPVSRDLLVRAVWGRDGQLHMPSNVLDVYVNYLRTKLRRAAVDVEIITVRGLGYMLRVESRTVLAGGGAAPAPSELPSHELAARTRVNG